MSNTKTRSTELHAAAMTLVTPEVQQELDDLLADGRDLERAQALRRLAEQEMAATGCSMSTARQHVAKALRLRRGEQVAAGGRGGSRPGAGRKPIGDAPLETAVSVRMDREIAASWGSRGERSERIRALLTALHDGDAIVMYADFATSVIVRSWLTARLAEVEALDLDDTTLEDWLRALVDALADTEERGRAYATKKEHDHEPRA